MGKVPGRPESVIDPFVDANNRRLIRVSDNGHVCRNQLVSRLKDFGRPQAYEEFGIGGRISTLAFNSAVYWASRAEGHSDGMVVGRPNGLELFKQENDQLLSVVDPDEGMLKWIKASGTAVILDGDGRSNTWEDNHAHKYAKQLARRYWTFGDVRLQIYNWQGDKVLRRVPSYRELLERYTIEKGVVVLPDETG